MAAQVDYGITLLRYPPQRSNRIQVGTRVAAWIKLICFSPLICGPEKNGNNNITIK